MNPINKYFLATAVTLGFVSSSFAEVVNIDFGQDFGGDTHSPEFVGTAAAPDAGTVWNGFYLPLSANIPSLASGVLKNSTGVSSSVTFLATQGDPPASNGGLAGANLPNLAVPADFSQTGKAALVQDQMYAWQDHVGTMVISGLSAPSYDLYIYSVRGGNFGDDGLPGGTDANADTPATNRTNFTIGATTLSPEVNLSSTTGLTLGEDYVVFTGLIPVGGLITMTWQGYDGGYGAISAMQLVSVPEPSSLITGCCALIGMLGFKRRYSIR